MPTFLVYLHVLMRCAGRSRQPSARVARMWVSRCSARWPREWMEAFSKLRDQLYFCSECGIENFFDFDRAAQGVHQHCWRCKKPSRLPLRIDIGDKKIFLNHNTVLYPHHFGKTLDFSTPHAKVRQHPTNPQKWGLQNLSSTTWTFKNKLGEDVEVAPQRSLPLKHGCVGQETCGAGGMAYA